MSEVRHRFVSLVRAHTHTRAKVVFFHLLPYGFQNYYRIYIFLMSIQNLKQNRCEHELQYHVCGGLAMCVMIFDCVLRSVICEDIRTMEL